MREIFAQVTGDDNNRQHPIEHVSSLEFYGPGYEDCDRRVPNISKINELLGWVPKRSLNETLRETIEYYFEYYGLRQVHAAE
jgi:UDP-apiose/xylose synthase